MRIDLQVVQASTGLLKARRDGSGEGGVHVARNGCIAGLWEMEGRQMRARDDDEA